MDGAAAINGSDVWRFDIVTGILAVSESAEG